MGQSANRCAGIVAARCGECQRARTADPRPAATRMRHPPNEGIDGCPCPVCGGQRKLSRCGFRGGTVVEPGAHRMTPRQIDLIRTSWSAVEPISDAAARLFYDRLFESDPAIKRLFAKTDMQAQRGILMQTLTL